MNKLFLGVGSVDITPKYSVQTVGFGRPDETSRGVRDSLCAGVSIWKFGDEVCALISIDHIGFSKESSDKLRNRVAGYLNVKKDKVMLCFSHTHSAPNDSIERDYFEWACNEILCGVERSANNMSPVLIGWENAYGDIGVNRRVDSEFLDRRIGILKAVDELSGDIKLILLRVTAHPNVLKGDNYLISADYFGETRDLLSKKYGCDVMITQGAAGNIAPKYFYSKIKCYDTNENTVFSETALNDMAECIYESVNGVIDDIKLHEAHNLNMYSVYKELKADVPTYERGCEIADEALKYCGIKGDSWLEEVKRLNDNGIKYQVENVEIQYFSLDEGCFAGVGHEIMCEFALKAEEKMNEYFYFGGYTNAASGYFPTEEEYDKGGFEVFWSMLIYYIYYDRVSPLNRECATELIEECIKNAPQYLRCIK